MDREVPVPVVKVMPSQARLKQSETAIAPSHQIKPCKEEDVILEDHSSRQVDGFEQVSKLDAKTQVALIHELMARLETEHIQAILEFALQEVSERRRRIALPDHNTRLVLKKDYSYQDRGLSQPTQYYVYLRRRKPKLDRYIGALFYIPQGCTLSYSLDTEGQIVFNSPHNIFCLRDTNNPAITQTVRLICLEPPPPEYTFTRQQNDVPDIYLHLEYLEPNTHQILSREVYPFPVCMYEGGKLDRYRWEVSLVTATPEIAEPYQVSKLPELTDLASQIEPRSEPVSNLSKPLSSNPSAELPTVFNQASSIQPAWAANEASLGIDLAETLKPSRQVIKLPTTKPLVLYLANSNNADQVLKRMRLWSIWSEKAMPQSKWQVVQLEEQAGIEYRLLNVRFKRHILSFSPGQAAVTLENSLPVLMKWFHDLGLAVSQNQSQKQFSAAQLKLAHSLFVDMSLPSNDPLIVFKQLFGVKFVLQTEHNP